MVQRSTPMFTSYRAYSGGGARTTIHEVDDDQYMQESKANFCKGESRDKIESPQNYGFTSVVADADMKDGQIEDSAEGFVSFMGGNRSFPVMGIMDDRRHRLIGLAKDAAKGATAMFGLKSWGQQLLNTEDGFFMTGNTKKKIRLALVDNKNDQQQQQSGGGGSGGGSSGGGGASTLSADAPTVGALADGGGSSGGGGNGAGGASGAGGGQQKGQKTLHKEDSKIVSEQNNKENFSQHGDYYQSNRGGSDSSTYYKDRHSSTQVTDAHCHINSQDTHIWVTPGGCFSDMPIIVKGDQLCKY